MTGSTRTENEWTVFFGPESAMTGYTGTEMVIDWLYWEECVRRQLKRSEAHV